MLAFKFHLDKGIEHPTVAHHAGKAGKIPNPLRVSLGKTGGIVDHLLYNFSTVENPIRKLSEATQRFCNNVAESRSALNGMNPSQGISAVKHLACNFVIIGSAVVRKNINVYV